MADMSFDVVIVGGGCKGLSTGIYLAKYGGMTVGIFEATHELGGGLASEQTAPGFIGNTHAIGQQSWYYNIVIKDDLPELWEEGFRQIGDANTTMVSLFPDDTCLTLYGGDRGPDLERSAAQIARFSKQDAETYLEIGSVYLKHLRPAFYEDAFSVPPPVGVPGPVAKAMANPEVIKAGLDPHIASMTPFQAFKVLFESEQLITLLLRSCIAMGFYADEAGMALPVLSVAYEFSTHVTTYGGAHNLAHACHRVLHRYGARTFTHSEVEKVIIENGTARGIQLKDGSRVEAKKAVISTLSPHQLCYDLIGPDLLSPKILRKIDALETSRICTFEVLWALEECPKWKAHDFNPDIDSEEIYAGIPSYSLGPKGLSSLMNECSLRRMNQAVPDPLMLVLVLPEEARLNPSGKFCQVLTEHSAPPAWAYPEEWWIKFHHERPDWKMQKFQEFAVNMDWDKVIGAIPVTPYYVAKHLKNMAPSGNWQIIDMIPSQIGSFRPIPELAQHRTPIKNLYATGSAFGGFPATSFCGSYSCYKVMAEDYGLRMPWNEKGRPY
jgi:beta-carotene ketolase (CrtO type)